MSSERDVAAMDAHNLAVAKADVGRKEALENCLAASGDAQRTCKDQADAKAAALSAKQQAQSLPAY